jgi:hypothetical protein
MSWFIKNPFGPDEDPVKHMVELLSAEAEKAGTGTPLSLVDKEILARESSPSDLMPEDLRQKAKELIVRIFEAEPDAVERDPKSFSDSFQWAGDSSYPNIVALAEEVARDISRTAFHPPRGWKLVRDRMQLIGCAVLVVLLMFAIVIGAGFLFGWK